MDGIVALCHFCEQHGPVVLMCTQPRRQTQLSGVGISSTSQQQQGQQNQQEAQMQQGQGQVRQISTPLAAQSSINISPSSTEAPTSGTSRFYDSFGTGSLQDQQQTNNCRACSVVTREELGFLSHDFTAKTDYISTQFPTDFNLIPVVRSACLRSLSSEDLPGREGPVYFGDDTNGHVISYAFFIKDSCARGCQVKFSFLLITWDQIFLMNLWQFVVKNFECMASRLQHAACHVYEEEVMSLSGVGGGGRSVTPPARGCRTPGGGAATPPSRPIGAASPGLSNPSMMLLATSPGRGCGYQNTPLLTSQAIAAGNAVESAYSTNSLGSSRKNRNRRATDSDMRSLIDLTKDIQILYRIHAWFTWLLRLSGRNWTVCSPLARGPPDEDLLVELEEHEGLQDDLSTNLGQLSMGQEAIPQCQNAQPLKDPSSLVIGQSLGWSDGSPEQETSLQLRLLLRLSRCLEEGVFSQVVQHVVTGRQVIVLPLEDSRLGSLTVAALSRFLPRGCIKMIIDSSEYVPAYVCNLLSLTPEAFVSCPPASDPYLLLQVSMYSPASLLHPLTSSSTGVTFDQHSSNSVEDEDSVKSEADLLLNSLHFVPTFGLSVQAQPPGCVRRQQLSGSIGGKSRRDSSTRSTSPAAWATSVRSSGPMPPSPSARPPRVISTLARQIVTLFQVDPPLHTSTFSLALAGMRQEWIDKARLLFSFKRCQGAAIGDDEACKKVMSLLTSGTASSEDEVVIRFWQNSLSQQTQQSVCHAAAAAAFANHRKHRNRQSSAAAAASSSVVASGPVPIEARESRLSSGSIGVGRDSAISPAISVPPHHHQHLNHHRFR